MTHAIALLCEPQEEKNGPGPTGTIKGEAEGEEDPPKRYRFKRNINPVRAAWDVMPASHLQGLAKGKVPVDMIVTIETYETKPSSLPTELALGKIVTPQWGNQAKWLNEIHQFKHASSSDYVKVKSQGGEKKCSKV